MFFKKKTSFGCRDAEPRAAAAGGSCRSRPQLVPPSATTEPWEKNASLPLRQNQHDSQKRNPISKFCNQFRIQTTNHKLDSIKHNFDTKSLNPNDFNQTTKKISFPLTSPKPVPNEPFDLETNHRLESKSCITIEYHPTLKKISKPILSPCVWKLRENILSRTLLNMAEQIHLKWDSANHTVKELQCWQISTQVRNCKFMDNWF